MHLKIKTKELQELVAKVYDIVPSKGISEYSTAVLVEKKDSELSVMAANLHSFATSYCNKEEHKSIEDFKFCVEAKLFNNALNAFDPVTHSELEIIYDKKVLKIESGKKKYKLPTFDSEQFGKPVHPEKDKSKSYTWTPEMRHSILEAMPFASKDSDNILYASVWINKKEIAATDTKDLYVKTYDKEFVEKEITMPAPVCDMLKKYAGDIVVDSDGRTVRFDTVHPESSTNRTGLEIVSTLIDMAFPDYQSIIKGFVEGSTNFIELKKTDFEKAINDVAFTSNPANKAVTLVYNKSKLTLKTKIPKRAASSEVDIECNSNMEKHSIMLCYPKVLKMLSVIPGNEIKIQLGAEPREAHFIQTDKLFVGTMPIRDVEDKKEEGEGENKS